ncbi:hypothetical protein V6Z11_A09G013500 [Gossypium hirsutum]
MACSQGTERVLALGVRVAYSLLMWRHERRWGCTAAEGCGPRERNPRVSISKVF